MTVTVTVVVVGAGAIVWREGKVYGSHNAHSSVDKE
jgi:hypothetical protein